jgi:hypothetical protein
MRTIVQYLYRLVQIAGHDHAGGSRTVPIDGANVQVKGSVDLGSHDTNRGPMIAGPTMSVGYPRVPPRNGEGTEVGCRVTPLDVTNL